MVSNFGRLHLRRPDYSGQTEGRILMTVRASVYSSFKVMECANFGIERKGRDAFQFHVIVDALTINQTVLNDDAYANLSDATFATTLAIA